MPASEIFSGGGADEAEMRNEKPLDTLRRKSPEVAALLVNLADRKRIGFETRQDQAEIVLAMIRDHGVQKVTKAFESTLLKDKAETKGVTSYMPYIAKVLEGSAAAARREREASDGRGDAAAIAKYGFLPEPGMTHEDVLREAAKRNERRIPPERRVPTLHEREQRDQDSRARLQAQADMLMGVTHGLD